MLTSLGICACVSFTVSTLLLVGRIYKTAGRPVDMSYDGFLESEDCETATRKEYGRVELGVILIVTIALLAYSYAPHVAEVFPLPLQ